MKHGFTMIELIFVIVILGILAAIAVPKLTSVKDDAEASKAVSNLGTFVNELTVYYTTHESTFPVFADTDLDSNKKPKDFTNVKEITVTSNGTAATTGTGGAITPAVPAKFAFKAGSTPDCIKIEPTGDAIILEPTLESSNGCKIAIAAAVKAGILHGEVDASGKVKTVGDGSAKDSAGQTLGAKTLISVSGGKSGMYDASGLKAAE